MNLNCPNCAQRLDPDTLSCKHGHHFAVQDGVLVLLSEEMSRRLEGFLEPYAALRAAEGHAQLDPAAYPLLPHGPAARGNLEWRLRQYDLAVIHRLLRSRPIGRILDIGPWNGWLSHRLAAQGHQVTAIDYFVEEREGLKAKRFYPVEWQAIQMDLDDLSVLGGRFDVVIVNRCLQFFEDPPAYAEAALQQVAPGGLLIMTGLAFFRDSRNKAQDVLQLRSHLNQHGLDFFKPMKGYLDWEDKARLEALGVALHSYPQIRLANLKARLWPDRPHYVYGELSRPGSPGGR